MNANRSKQKLTGNIACFFDSFRWYFEATIIKIRSTKGFKEEIRRFKPKCI